MKNGIEYKHCGEGKLLSETTYRKGRRHGKQRCYYDNGLLSDTYYYLHGELVTPEEYHKHKLIEKLGEL